MNNQKLALWKLIGIIVLSMVPFVRKTYAETADLAVAEYAMRRLVSLLIYIIILRLILSQIMDSGRENNLWDLNGKRIIFSLLLGILADIIAPLYENNALAAVATFLAVACVIGYISQNRFDFVPVPPVKTPLNRPRTTLTSVLFNKN